MSEFVYVKESGEIDLLNPDDLGFYLCSEKDAAIKKVTSILRVLKKNTGVSLPVNSFMSKNKKERYAKVFGCWTDLNIVGDIKSTSKEFSQYNIVSGPCLFSGNSVSFECENGDILSPVLPGTEFTSKIVNVSINSDFSLYEEEALLRLSSFVNDFISVVDRDKVKVSINIPKVEYYLYLMPAFYKKLISKEQLIAWFDSVNKRSEELRQRYTQAVTDVEVEIYNPLDCLSDYIRRIISQGGKLDSKKMMSIICEANDSFVTMVFSANDNLQKKIIAGKVAGKTKKKATSFTNRVAHRLMADCWENFGEAVEAELASAPLQNGQSVFPSTEHWPELLKAVSNSVEKAIEEMTSNSCAMRTYIPKYQDISYLGYMIAEIRAGMRGLGIVIENPPEKRILDGIERLMPYLNCSLNILALYPNSRVFMSDTDNELYHTKVVSSPDQTKKILTTMKSLS